MWSQGRLVKRRGGTLLERPCQPLRAWHGATRPPILLLVFDSGETRLPLVQAISQIRTVLSFSAETRTVRKYKAALQAPLRMGIKVCAADASPPVLIRWVLQFWALQSWVLFFGHCNSDTATLSLSSHFLTLPSLFPTLFQPSLCPLFALFLPSLCPLSALSLPSFCPFSAVRSGQGAGLRGHVWRHVLLLRVPLLVHQQARQPGDHGGGRGAGHHVCCAPWVHVRTNDPLQPPPETSVKLCC